MDLGVETVREGSRYAHSIVVEHGTPDHCIHTSHRGERCLTLGTPEGREDLWSGCGHPGTSRRVTTVGEETLVKQRRTKRSRSLVPRTVWVPKDRGDV